MTEAAEKPVPFSQMTLVDWLDDLTVRFLLNLPPAELSSVPRLCFQVEEAQWFYEDFIRPANPNLPSLNLRQFCMTLFQHCPLLSGFDAAQHLAAYEEFLAYKVRVPVRGAILMNDTMEKVLLVRGWKKGAGWSFPRGKINKNEKDIDCAIREVYEETGFDINAAGLVRLNEENGQVKAIDITMREQHMKLFVFRGVPLDTYFEPKTRKEISKIQWYNVRDLPGFKKNKGGPGNGQGEAHASRFYMVAPFLGHLKKWIAYQRKSDEAQVRAQHQKNVAAPNILNAGIAEDEGDTEVDATYKHSTGILTSPADGLKKLLAIDPTSPSPTASPHKARAHGQSSGQTDLLALLQGGQLSNDTQENVTVGQNMNTVFSHHRDSRTQSSDRQVVMALQQQPQRSFQAHPLPYEVRGQQQHYPRGFQPPSAGLAPLSRPQSHHSPMQSARNGQQGSPHVPGVFPIAFTQDTAPAIQSWVAQAPSNRFQAQPPRQSSQQPPASLLAAFTSQQSRSPFDATVNGPRIPEASKLPAPKLNAHSMKLLDAFRTTNDRGSTIEANDLGGANRQKSGNQQQTALLNLFKKGPATESASPSNATTSPNVKPTPATPSERIVVELPRRLTANEITRTLPLGSKQKSPKEQGLRTPTSFIDDRHEQPRPHDTPRLSGPQLTTHHPQRLPHRDSSSRQKFTQDRPQNLVNDNRTPSQLRQAEHDPPAPNVSILQRPSSRHTDVSSRPANKKVSHGNSSPTPPFSILQRPTSSAGKGSRPSVPQSPLRKESNLTPFQPQVLKRPDAGLVNDSVLDAGAPIVPGKTDQLLALFGKAPTTISSPQQSDSVASENEPHGKPQQRDMLLNLFNSGNAPRNPGPVTTTPPPAPQLVPERNPSRPQNSARQQNQQHLLSLISVQNSSMAGSPSTPISPFTLGTPVSKLLPNMHRSSENSGESRSRIGSVASMASNGTNSGRQTPTPATVTPTEAKGVLLDYLNGVVKQGYQGARRS